MEDETVGRKYCSGYECPAYCVPHRWVAGTTLGRGWFHQKNGDSWCPRHIPSWVEAWREKKRGSNG